MKLYKQITVDLYNPYPLPKMTAQQNNIGRGALVTLTAGGTVVDPSEYTVTAWATKPDMTVSYAMCKVTNGKVALGFTSQMLAVSGELKVEIRLIADGVDISTPIFIVCVGKSNISNSAIESQNEFTVFQQVLNEVNQLSKEIADEAKNRNNADAVLNARINALSTLEEGSTTGDAELADIRVGYDGNVYPSAGDAVRGQVGELKSDLVDIATTWVGRNILQPDAITDGYFISHANGTLTQNVSYFVSDFVKIEADKDYTFSEWYDDSNNSQNSRYIMLFYDANRNPISDSYVNQAGVYYLTCTSPSNAAFVRVSSLILHNSTVDHTYMLEQSSSRGSRTKYEKITVLKDASNILYGKKWVACGDSFTHGDYSGSTDNNQLDVGRYMGQNKVYPFYIGNRNNMDIVNEAVNGSTMCLNDGTHNAFSTANGRYTQIPADADYITLYFGINDGNYQSPIGTIDDADNTTFYGAWNVVLDYLIRNHPYAKIGIIVTNGTSMAYINAEKAVAEKWGIPYLDMNDIQTPVMNRSNNQSITNEVREFRTQIFSVNASSNTHPSAKAHEYESTFIEAFLRRL